MLIKRCSDYINPHCVKSIQIRSYFWSLFSCIQSEYRKIRARNNSLFGHFSRSAIALFFCFRFYVERWRQKRGKASLGQVKKLLKCEVEITCLEKSFGIRGIPQQIEAENYHYLHEELFKTIVKRPCSIS